jgi:hypothetical protein
MAITSTGNVIVLFGSIERFNAPTLQLYVSLNPGGSVITVETRFTDPTTGIEKGGIRQEYSRGDLSAHESGISAALDTVVAATEKAVKAYMEGLNATETFTRV